jgi:hypothetical protein
LCSGSGAFFTQLTIGVSELQVLLQEVEGEMMEGERAAFATSQETRHSHSHSALDSRLISSEKTAFSTTAAIPDGPATNHQASTDATVTQQAIVIQPSLLSLSDDDLRFVFVENMSREG